MLENMTDTNDVLREVALENENFSLSDFLDGEISYKLAGACGFITRTQYFYCEASKDHALVFENVCGSVFEGNDPGVNAYYKVNKPYFITTGYNIDSWKYANMNFGVVCMQILSGKSICIWIPEKINNFQKEKLLEFCHEIKEINKGLLESGGKQVTPYFSIYNGREFTTNLKIDEFINQIDKFVDDNCPIYEEHMISDYVSEKHK